MRLAPVALIVLAVVAFASWQLLGNDGDATDTATTGNGGGSSLLTPGTLGGGAATQSPGEGGAAATSTSTLPAGSAGAGSTATTQTPTATTGDQAGVEEGEPGDDETAVVGDEGTEEEDVTGSAGVETPVIVDPSELSVVDIESLEGETLFDVAARWGLDIATLVWANPSLGDPSAVLEPRTIVTIPPVDGVIHVVQAGETMESIAATYGVDTTAITSVIQNEVTSDADLVPGLRITVFGAEPISRASIATYTVNEGDDLWEIASYYGLNPLTIAVANDLPDDYLIYPGQQLIIPPADGILYTVQEGESVESIAGAFGVSPDLIRGFPFNNLGSGEVLQAGQQILIPGIESITGAAGGKGGTDDVPAQDPFAASVPTDVPLNATGTFMWPVSGNLTQEFHAAHNGIDVANAAYSPVVAADGGVVTFAGWNDYGLGYAVAIDHENGYVTWYGHMAEPPAVTVGQRVAQGQWLGPMGSTGKSTGPHVHFILLSEGIYEDPLAYLP